MTDHMHGNPGAAARRFLSEQQELYAVRWSEGNAEALGAGDHYQWMARFVEGHPRVLEIGTGDGRGTAALLEHGHRVLSLDENPFCLDRAGARLAELGYPVAQLGRGETLPVYDPRTGELGYTVRYAAVPERDLQVDGAVLVESNILNDPSMWEALRDGPPFDAITCWLIGIHAAVHADVKLNDMPTAPEPYRIRVQNWLYELAEDILIPGGVLHVVDRLMNDDPDILNEIRGIHEDQASVTTLRVDVIEARPYEEPQGDVRIEVGFTAQYGDAPNAAQSRLVSVLARKPE